MRRRVTGAGGSPRTGRRSDRRIRAVLLAVLCGAAAARSWWEHRLRSRLAGKPPGIRTDDGVLLHTEAEGRPDADRTVVLVHGFSARADEFRHQRRALAPHARLVAFDQRGHGLSGWKGRDSADLSRMGRDLAQLVRLHAERPVVLVGHSMGGMVVMAFASQHPEIFRSAVAGVALISTSAGRLAETHLPRAATPVLRIGFARAVSFLHWSLAPVADAVKPYRRRRAVEWLCDRLFGPADEMQEHMDLILDMWDSTPRAVAARIYPGLLEHDRLDSLECLAAVPVLVLTGTEDSTIPTDHSDQIAEAIGPSARLVKIPGAGHMINLTHPDAVNRELLDLLHRVSHLSER